MSKRMKTTRWQQDAFEVTRREGLNRREVVGLGIMAGAVTLVGARSAMAKGGGGGGACTGMNANELFPTSPLIGGTGVDANGRAVGSAFTDPLPIPEVLAPTPRSVWSSWSNPPGPGQGQQDSDGGTHQIWPSTIGYPDPNVYQIKLQLSPYSFSSLPVLPINNFGLLSTPPAGAPVRVRADGTVASLPQSALYSFNGKGPGGTRINAEYGKPNIVRFENHLDENPFNLDRQDFGAPDYSFLTHLHNGHTAPESDGNPNYRFNQIPKMDAGYQPGQWVDNLYLNWPAGGDDREKQSFFWFHDHKMDHTGANVYKGMVGLYPIYDPKNGLDMGDETQGFRLPGVRTNNADGSFSVDYDIPLAFYDLAIEDGITQHQDYHNGCGETHPEWWGKQYFRHFPNHGFVGDVFTTNGKAYPVLEVKRRKYRFRFLDCSISRIYEFKLMTSTSGPKSSASLGYSLTELQGQYRIPDGQQCMKFTQIACDGGLLANAIQRDSFELWPAKRREFVVDFTKYQDGTPTKKGDVIYLTNVMKMMDGRLWNSSSRFAPDPAYKIPMVKIVIGDDAVDNSLMPTVLRPMPDVIPSNWQSLMANRKVFTLGTANSNTDAEIHWGIGGPFSNSQIQPFDPTVQLTTVKKNSYELWEIRNGGGGWVHPLHLHMEEHRTLMRNGKIVFPNADAGHPEDGGKEDLIALDPAESVIIYRGFRDFTGPYVTHCHNLAHEDHAMMFGWSIVP